MTDTLHRPLTLDDFRPLVGEEFAFDCTPAPLTLRLVEADSLVDRGDLPRPPFILVFRSGLEAMLIDGMYTITHDRLAPAAISIGSLTVPHSAEPGYYYQAVFN